MQLSKARVLWRATTVAVAVEGTKEVQSMMSYCRGGRPLGEDAPLPCCAGVLRICARPLLLHCRQPRYVPAAT